MEVLEFGDEPPQGPENFGGVQDGKPPPPNQLDDMAGGDAKKKAQLALSSDGPYAEEIKNNGKLEERKREREEEKKRARENVAGSLGRPVDLRRSMGVWTEEKARKKVR